MSFRSFKYLITGDVHGVGFRYFTKRIAEKEGIVGWVKNDPSGHVVGVAQGTHTAMQKFKQVLAKGPLHANVTGVQISSEEISSTLEFGSFDIRH